MRFAADSPVPRPRELKPAAPIEKMRIRPGYVFDRDAKVYISLPEMRIRKPLHEAEALMYTRYFQEELAQTFRRRKFTDVVKDPAEAPSASVIVEPYITRFGAGSVFLRYIIGFGLGATDVQAEILVWENKNGVKTEIVAFADRRRAHGSPTFGLNRESLNTPEIMIQSLKTIAEAAGAAVKTSS